MVHVRAGRQRMNVSMNQSRSREETAFQGDVTAERKKRCPADPIASSSAMIESM